LTPIPDQVDVFCDLFSSLTPKEKPMIVRILQWAGAGLVSAWLVVVCLAGGLVLGSGLKARAGAPVIAAASTLQFALPEIAEAFRAETGLAVTPSFGSSGNFARQIREGAPFEMFLAADESFVFDLAKDGLARDQGAIYAQGRIVLIAPHDAVFEVDSSLDGLARALSAGQITRFAIANPEHAPYGMRAQEALEHRGLWQALQRVMVLGENVSQAAQFATTGNADGGIIAYSLALSPWVGALGRYALIPGEWHAPLNQRMVLLKGAGPVAQAFYEFMNTPKAIAILQRYGFVRPEE
jgi:molybdate transport system substrate-binding protein